MGVFLLMVASLLAGAAGCLLLQFYFFKRFLWSQPKREAAPTAQFPRACIPPDLQQLLKDPERLQRPETCFSFNLFAQFLWKELKDTNLVRHWMVKKLSVEFKELLTAKALGHFMESIVCRGFSLGPVFPVVSEVAVQNAKTTSDGTQLEELDLLLDIDYPEPGGFELALDIDLVFRRSIYLCIKVTSLKGRGRLRLTRDPYTHWSFAFVEEPHVTFKVDSYSQGRNLPQVPNLIIDQIKRTLRKRHTLPFYKIRYKPFFPPQPSGTSRFKHAAEADRFLGDRLLPGDSLSVTILSCSRLRASNFPVDAHLFVTASLDAAPWTELLTPLDVEICKNNSGRVGLSFKDCFVAEKGKEVVVVDVVESQSPAMMADIREGDILISINETKVASAKQAVHLLRKTLDSFSVRVERGPVMSGGGGSRRDATADALLGIATPGQTLLIEEDIVRVPRKKSSTAEPGAANADSPNGDEDADDDDDSYVNITVKRDDDKVMREAARVVELSGSVDERRWGGGSGGGAARVEEFSRPSSMLLLAGGGGYYAAAAAAVAAGEAKETEESAPSSWPGRRRAETDADASGGHDSDSRRRDDHDQSHQSRRQKITKLAKRTTTSIISSINRRRERSSSPAPFGDFGDDEDDDAASKSTPSSPALTKRAPGRPGEGSGRIGSALASIPFVRGDKHSSRNGSLPKSLDSDSPISSSSCDNLRDDDASSSSRRLPSASFAVSTSVSMSTLSATPSSGAETRTADLRTSSSFKELPSIVVDRNGSSEEVVTGESTKLGLRRRVKTLPVVDVEECEIHFMDDVDSISPGAPGAAGVAVPMRLAADSSRQSFNEGDLRSSSTLVGDGDGPFGSRDSKVSLNDSSHDDDDVDEIDDDDEENGIVTDSDVDAADEGTECGVRQTRLVRVSAAPSFDEKFQFTIKDTKSFLNVVVWCRCPEKLDKAGRVTRDERDELCGHASLRLTEIVMECLVTSQGDHQQTVNLTCPEPIAQAIKNPASAGGGVSGHRGHNPLLMDGDVSIAFRHSAGDATDRTAAMKEAKEKRESSNRPPCPEIRPTASAASAAAAPTHSSLSAPASSSSPKPGRRRYSPAAALTKLRPYSGSAGRAADEAASAASAPRATDDDLMESNHLLVSAVFTTATYCTSCRSRIWTKKAFQCRACSSVCHKKCIAKFQSESVCLKADLRAPPTSGRAAPHSSGEKPAPPSTLSTSPNAASFHLKSPISFGPEGLAVEGGGFSINIPSPKSPSTETVKGLYGKAIARFGPSPKASPTESPRGSPDFKRRFKDVHVSGKEPSPGYQIPSSSSSSSEEKFMGGGENEEVLSKLMERCGLVSSKSSDVEIGSHDEVVVSMAKSAGKELFAELPPTERKEKLEEMTSKLQSAIDAESENRAELAKELKQVVDPKVVNRLQVAVRKSEDKMQSMAVLMLHYCSGLADCLESFDSDKEVSSDSEEEEEEDAPGFFDAPTPDGEAPDGFVPDEAPFDGAESGRVVQREKESAIEKFPDSREDTVHVETTPDPVLHPVVELSEDPVLHPVVELSEDPVAEAELPQTVPSPGPLELHPCQAKSESMRDSRSSGAEEVSEAEEALDVDQ